MTTVDPCSAASRDLDGRMHCNELPFPVSDGVAAAVAGGTARMQCYPDPGASTLCAAVARRWDVEPDWVVAGTGSIGVIAQALRAARSGELLLPWPGFDAYPALALVQGHTVTLTAVDADGAPDLDDVEARIGRDTSVVVICSPNSPTGGVVSGHRLRALLGEIPPGVLVILDQAYVEFAGEPHAVLAVELAREFPHLLVTRTFSKAYGLAALRVGYGIAQPALARRLAGAGVPYTVSAPAESAALAALADEARMRGNVARVVRERRRMARALAALGAEVVEGHGNFVWVPDPGAAEETAAAVASAGIAVKVFPGYGVRVTAGTAEQTDRLVRAWPRAGRVLLG